MEIELSNAEILDKLSILIIKKKYILEIDKIVNIDKEIKYLSPIVNTIIENNTTVYYLYQKLIEINEILWNIEDKIRQKESTKIFDNEFIHLARSVYYTNDERADIKKNINIISQSNFIEEKSYQTYK